MHIWAENESPKNPGITGESGITTKWGGATLFCSTVSERENPVQLYFYILGFFFGRGEFKKGSWSPFDALLSQQH